MDEIKPLVSQQADLSHVRVFLAHGVHDNVLGVHYAREARKYLEGLHVSVDYHEYGTAHGIDENILHDLRAVSYTHLDVYKRQVKESLDSLTAHRGRPWIGLNT